MASNIPVAPLEPFTVNAALAIPSLDSQSRATSVPVGSFPERLEKLASKGDHSATQALHGFSRTQHGRHMVRRRARPLPAAVEGSPSHGFGPVGSVSRRQETPLPQVVEGDPRLGAAGRILGQRPPRVLDGFLLLRAAGVQLPTDVQRVDISSRGLVDTKREDLAFFSHLEEINASDNALPISSFSPINNLRVLRLHCNSLAGVKIPPGTFERLCTLDLSFNALRPRSFRTLARLPSLRELDLSHNGLERLPTPSQMPVETYFPSLEVLVLSNNKLSEAFTWETLAVCPKLKEVNLADNLLDAVPASASTPGCFPCLEWLSVARNRLSTRQAVARLLAFPQLQELVLIGNPITGSHPSLAPPEAKRASRRSKERASRSRPWREPPAGEGSETDGGGSGIVGDGGIPELLQAAQDAGRLTAPPGRRRADEAEEMGDGMEDEVAATRPAARLRPRVVHIRTKEPQPEASGLTSRVYQALPLKKVKEDRLPSNAEWRAAGNRWLFQSEEDELEEKEARRMLMGASRSPRDESAESSPRFFATSLPRHPSPTSYHPSRSTGPRGAEDDEDDEEGEEEEARRLLQLLTGNSSSLPVIPPGAAASPAPPSPRTQRLMGLGRSTAGSEGRSAGGGGGGEGRWWGTTPSGLEVAMLGRDTRRRAVEEEEGRRGGGVEEEEDDEDEEVIGYVPRSLLSPAVGNRARGGGDQGSVQRDAGRLRAAIQGLRHALRHPLTDRRMDEAMLSGTAPSFLRSTAATRARQQEREPGSARLRRSGAAVVGGGAGGSRVGDEVERELAAVREAWHHVQTGASVAHEVDRRLMAGLGRRVEGVVSRERG